MFQKPPFLNDPFVVCHRFVLRGVRVSPSLSDLGLILHGLAWPAHSLARGRGLIGSGLNPLSI
jgi:hypothetical protein